MGAQFFSDRVKANDVQVAFQTAVTAARYEHGHGGYTGTIAEKDSFVMIPLPEGIDPEDYANLLDEKEDARISDKWGPAGCFQLGPEEFFFFGTASS